MGEGMNVSHHCVQRRLLLFRLPYGKFQREGVTVGRPEQAHKSAAKARPLYLLDVSCRIQSNRKLRAPNAALLLLLTLPVLRFLSSATVLV